MIVALFLIDILTLDLCYILISVDLFKQTFPGTYASIIWEELTKYIYKMINK